MTLSATELSTASAWNAPAATFGPFRLLPLQRVLLEDGKPVKLGSRAFDILAILVERAGTTVPTRDILARVWPNMVVEQATLRVHVAALRKALGETPERRYIRNVAREGYALLAQVRQPPDGAAPGFDSARAELIHTLVTHLPQRRFVTLTGPGGVGKSTVAQAVAARLAAQLGPAHCALYCADCAEEAPAAALAEALAGDPAAAAAPPSAADPLSAPLAMLAGVAQRTPQSLTLILLDNCERHVDAAAALAERLLREVPGLVLLATSREALRATGEWVQRVEPLACPPSDTAGAAAALAYPAVALFAERAAAVRGGYTLADADTPAVVALCRRLDGLPLALELAAERLDLFQPRELAARLDERLHMLKGGRRTAPPRHRSLRACLEWSWATLSAVEQAVLCRLALFSGPFPLPRAVRVAVDGLALNGPAVEEALATLAAKSLLAPVPHPDGLCLRLYENVRVHALSLLAPDDAAHARFAADCLAAAANEGGQRPLDDVRTALTWAFGADGDLPAGIGLLIASAGAWWDAGRLPEHRDWLEAALGRIADTGGNPTAEMALCAALGAVRVYLDGPGAGRGAFARAFALAERTTDTERLADAFSGLALEDMLAGDYPAALVLAERFRQAIQGRGARGAQLVHDRVAALALHLSGEQTAAATLARALQNQTVPAVCTRRRTALHTDENVVAGAVLARSRWLLGYPDDALRVARCALQRARAVGADTSLCYVLGFALFPVAWWRGDRPVALQALAELEEAARRLPNWRGLARQYRSCVVDGGQTTLGTALSVGPHRETLATLDARYLDDALLRRAGHGGARWCAAELRRLHGERLLGTGDSAARAEAERLFHAALLLARGQQARAWELRAAISLARLWQQRGASAAAHELLGMASAGWTEGLATADVLTAKKLLAQWEPAAGREKAGSAGCALPAGRELPDRGGPGSGSLLTA